MNTRFIILTRSRDARWAIGETLPAAVKSLEKILNRRIDTKALRVARFESELPFTPHDRMRRENEADCWVDHTGQVQAVQCQTDWVVK